MQRDDHSHNLCIHGLFDPFRPHLDKRSLVLPQKLPLVEIIITEWW
jgi:hypothetical protein